MKSLEVFKKKYKKQLLRSEERNFIDVLFWELQKTWGKKFEKRMGVFLCRFKKIEQEILPEIFEIYKKRGIGIALWEYENLFCLRYRRDRRGQHRKKEMPFDKVLIDEYNLIKQKLSNGLKNKYRNLSLKLLHLKNLFPEIDKDYLEKYHLSPNWELAHYILSYGYGCSALTLRNKLAEANKSHT